MLGCTVFAAAAQVLMKFGAMHPMPAINPADSVQRNRFSDGTAGQLAIAARYSLHACNAFLLILALRDGELSMLYPIIALTYVWVNLLSMYFFHEHLNCGSAGYRAGDRRRGSAGKSESAQMTQTPLSSILLVLCASLIGSFGAVFLKLGAAPLKDGLRHILNWKLARGRGAVCRVERAFCDGVASR